jgi:AraC-like DNA-binding protein
LIELSSNLLPTGAWIYTNQFDNDMITFVFKIKRVFIFLLLPFGIYTLLQVRKCVKSYNTSLTDDKNKVSWIKEMLTSLGILLILILLPDLARLFLIKSVYFFLIQAIAGSLIIIYLGIRNLNMQINTAIISAEVVNPYNPETNNNFKLILNFVQTDSMYLNPELRITDLAEKISLSPNYVSKIINENAGMNFNDFVNEYRVNEVIGKFKNKEHFKKSIYALAQESGFKSKSTFQTAFRKSTGKTPTEYLKSSEIQ